MRFVADLHLHSRFSRATSRDLTLPNLHAWAQRKGIFLLGTGDITHPGWLEEVAEQLVPAEEGLFRLRPDLAREADLSVPPACRGEVRFVLQGEVSTIYKHEDAVRKVHHVVFCPGLPEARRFLGTLDRLGNVRSDGRPILGLPSRDLLEVLLESGSGCRLIPAHAWTPWFSILGAKSGYDSVEACFGDLAGEITALETGLSSDPAMNWQVSALDRFALISNSDAHSPPNVGREANQFALEPSYDAVFGSLRPGDSRFLGTLEFFPEHGKYHLDGHRKCGVRLSPRETRELGGRCPVCRGKITVGVLHRVGELADRPAGERPPNARPYASLVPLAEVVGECLGVGRGAKKVRQVADRLLAGVGPELAVLREAPLEEVASLAGPVVAEGVGRAREGRLHIAGGYDGEFGTVRLFSPEERAELGRQGALFAVPAAAEETKPTRGPAGEAELGLSWPGAPAPEPERRPPAAQPLPLFPAGLGVEAALVGLNPEQREAVAAPAGPLLIVAGPGTGKTRTLTHRIAHKVLSGELPPRSAAAITFTNRAADELATRLRDLLGEVRAARVTVCTLHRLGLEILRSEAARAGLPADFAVLGEDECAELLREVVGCAVGTARALLESVSRARRGGPRGEGDPVADAYEAALTERGAVDLDDLILRPVRLLKADAGARSRWEGRFAHLAVDEFQDLDDAQFRLISLLAPPGADLTAIGDPDQSIYGFRGADPSLFERFLTERPGARRVELVRNYRSTPTILAASAGVLGGGNEELRPGLEAFLADGPRVALAELANERAEADFVAREVERLLGGTSHHSIRRGGDGEGQGVTFGEVAVLFRLRAQRAALEEALDRRGIPWAAAGGEPAMLRGKGRQVLRRLRRRGAAAGTAAGAVRQVLGELGLSPEGPVAAAWIAAAASAGNLSALLEDVVLRTPDDDYDRRAERVSLLTLHAAKGLEFPVVFVVGCEEGILPWVPEEGGEPGDPAEERRLFYVGMTRAGRILYLTRSRTRRLYGRTRRAGPTPFLKDIREALLQVRRTGEVSSARRGGRQLTLF